MSRPATSEVVSESPAAAAAHHSIGATRKRSGESARRRAARANAPPTASISGASTRASARPVRSGGNGVPSTNEATRRIGVTRPPSSTSASPTNGAPLRRMNAPVPNSTAAVTTSARGRQASPTSPNAKTTKPRTPARTSATPAYARPWIANSAVTLDRRARWAGRPVAPGQAGGGGGRGRAGGVHIEGDGRWGDRRWGQSAAPLGWQRHGPGGGECLGEAAGSDVGVGAGRSDVGGGSKPTTPGPPRHGVAPERSARRRRCTASEMAPVAASRSRNTAISRWGSTSVEAGGTAAIPTGAGGAPDSPVGR